MTLTQGRLKGDLRMLNSKGLESLKSHVARALEVAFWAGILCFCVAGVARAVEVTRGPVIQSLMETSVIITWRTDTPSDAVVEYGRTGDFEMIACDEARGLVHSLTLHHLEPATEYSYRIRSNGEVLAPVATFRTANPESQTSFSFGVIGDPGRGNQVQYDEAALLDALKTRFVLMAGDIVTPHGEWENYDPQIFTPYSSLMPKIPFWPALGNHDYETDNAAPYIDAFSLPTNNPAETERYYSFDYGNAHFIVIDGESPHHPGSPQYQWLVNDLAHNRREWNFAVCHYPPYSSSYYGPESTGFAMRKDVGPLLEAFGVDIYFAGHKHHYERFFPITDEQIDEEDGVRYVVTGGGGARLSTVYGSELTAYHESVHHIVHLSIEDDVLNAEMIRSDGTLGDTFNFQSREWTAPIGQIDREECVLHLRFDEDGGDWAFDSSPAGQDGYLGDSMGADPADPTWVSEGVSGGCLAFDPRQTPQFVTVLDQEGIFDFSEEFTLMGWVKTDQMNPWGTVVSGGEYKYALYSANEGKAQGYFDDFSPSATGAAEGGAVFGDWAHVALTYDQGEISLFCNGEFQKSVQPGGELSMGVEALFVGFDGYPGDGFRGLIDEVKVFRRALTPKQVRVEVFSDFAELEIPQPPAFEEPRPDADSSDLVCQLSFDERSGQTMADSSGYGNDGIRGESEAVETTDPSFAPASKYGPGALEFDGAGDRVTVPDLSDDFDLSDEFTTMAWIYVTDRGPWRAIVSGGEYAYGMYLTDDGSLRAYFRETAPAASSTAASGELSYGTWHHVALVKVGKSIALYLNGQREMVNTLTQDTISPVSVLRVGYDGYPGDFFKGCIDEVKVYRRGLSQAEIAREMTETFGTPYTPGVEADKDSPLAVFSFEEGSGQSVSNSSPDGGAEGYLGGASSFDAADPTWSVGGGVDGSHALRFDGTDQMVTVSDDDGRFDLDQQMTLMAWVRHKGAGGWKAIVSGGDYHYGFYLHSGGALRAYFSDLSPKATPAGGATIPADTWTHVAMTKDRATVRLYIDGVEVSSSEHSGSIPPVDRFRIGFDGYSGDGFDGEIDEVRVFDRVLSAAEILEARGE